MTTLYARTCTNAFEFRYRYTHRRCSPVYSSMSTSFRTCSPVQFSMCLQRKQRKQKKWTPLTPIYTAEDGNICVCMFHQCLVHFSSGWSLWFLNNANIKASETPVKYICTQNRKQQLQFLQGEAGSLREWLLAKHTTTQVIRANQSVSQAHDEHWGHNQSNNKYYTCYQLQWNDCIDSYSA